MCVLRLRVEGDDHLGTLVCDGRADGIAVIATVGQQSVEAAARGFDQRGCHSHVGRIAGRDHQDAWTPGGIGQSVDLAGAATARGADALREGPPFAPAAERWTLILVESIATDPHAPLYPLNASKTANHTPCRLQR